MVEFVEDLFKIYNSAIDSYNAKILQTINEKYTIIDKAMLATYLYIKMLDELEIEDNLANEVLINYLLKQIIYGETGNLSLEITDKSKAESYKKVIDNLVIEKFAYKNRILKHLKYQYKVLSNNKYIELLDFCEEIAQYCIMEKLAIRGNKEAEIYLKSLKVKFLDKMTQLKNEENSILKEEYKILEYINEDKFDITEYKKLIDVALNLRDVYRYSSLTTVVLENVLFHQYTITITSIIFAEYLNEELGEDIDIYKIMHKSLVHDFGEYKGNEIVGQVKYYNEDTKRMFAEMEETDEKELENKIGKNLYKIIVHYKSEQEGYIAELLDKILGIMKLWIESGYMNNATYSKSICSIYQNRFKHFKNTDRISNVKNKGFLLDLLRESYIYIKERLMEKDRDMFLQYFSEAEELEMKQELELIKKDKNAFLA